MLIGVYLFSIVVIYATSFVIVVLNILAPQDVLLICVVAATAISSGFYDKANPSMKAIMKTTMELISAFWSVLAITFLFWKLSSYGLDSRLSFLQDTHPATLTLAAVIFVSPYVGQFAIKLLEHPCVTRWKKEKE